MDPATTPIAAPIAEQVHEEGPLTLRVREGTAGADGTPAPVLLEWVGTSMARDPSAFVLPILTRALALCGAQGRRLVMDFRKLEYLNSSSMTPVIRLLEQARKGQAALTLLYDQRLKWQALSFSALMLFRTPDGRIDIRGAGGTETSG